MTLKIDVEDFLAAFKAKLSVFGYFLINRDKNDETIEDLELKEKDIKKVLETLTVKEYSEGPKQEDFYDRGEMWIFGKTIKKVLIYIKITLAGVSKPVICISFHKAEYEMNFPFNE
jgi:hypothetical protein